MRRFSPYGAEALWVRWILIVLILLALGLRLWRLDLLPPGLFFDEAFNGWDARRVAFEAYHPVYFAANNGREPLFIYLLALSVRIFGPTAYALRLVSTLAGMLAVPAIYAAARSILRPVSAELYDRTHSPFIAALPALVAAAGMAVSYWHLSLSRLVFRAVLLPTLSALALAFFWRAWHGRRRSDYAWAGVLAALSLYSYIAARFLPLVIGLFVLTELVGDLRLFRSERAAWRERWRPRARGLAWMLAVGFLLLAPLLVTFLRSPELLSARIVGISVFTAAPEEMPGTPLQRLGHNLLAATGGFYVTGDGNVRHNLPGRPVNDPFLALLFTVGWLAALSRIKRPWPRLLLIWLAVMLLPAILSTEALHALRSAGALPPLVLLYGLGAASLVLAAWRLSRLRAETRPRLGLRGVVSISLRRPGFCAQRGSATPVIARETLSTHQPCRSQTGKEHRILGLLSLALLAGVAIGSGAWTAYDYFERWSGLPALGNAFSLDAQLAAEQVVHLLSEPGSRPLVVSSDFYEQPQMAYMLGKVRPENALPLDLVGPASPRLSVLHRVNADQRQATYLVWRAPDGVHAVWLDPLAWNQATGTDPAGDTTWFRWPSAPRDWPQIGLTPLAADAVLRPRSIRYPLDVTFADGVKLVGYDVAPDQVTPGAQGAVFRLVLFWDVSGASQPVAGKAAITASAPRGDFLMFVHLVGGGGVRQSRDAPIGGEFGLPWHAWLGARSPVEDVSLLAVPADMPPGNAHFEIGLYLVPPVPSALLERIPVVNAQGQPTADQEELGAVLIGNQVPTVDMAGLIDVGFQFDQRIELLGWKAASDPAHSRRVLVDLGWKALDRSTADYTAFVHLVDDNGRIIAQHDAAPGGPTNPTTRWVPGETVRSSFALDLPEGVSTAGARLRVGLYEPVSGRRLSVTAAADRSAAVPGADFAILSGDLPAIEPQ